jgi:zinc D-Ala-D-Ala carboxypeptidase
VAHRQPARTTARPIRIRWFRVAVLLVVIAAVAAILGDRFPASSPSTASSPSAAASPVHVPRSERRREADGAVSDGATVDEHRGPLGEADGAVPDGATVFDDEIPGVARLDPALLAAVRRAATDAGIEFVVESGWRSAAYQEHLLQEAIARYGSEAEAARWVATPDTSAHVSGDAVDIGPADATAWLSAHGAEYGLCRIYGNEPWHYELRPEAVDHGCPSMYADAAHDPRMQQ